jgi:hypothetical protein
VPGGSVRVVLSMSRVSRRVTRGLVLAVSAVSLGLLASPVTLSQPAAAGSPSSGPVSVGADYQISLNGFDIGEVRYRSQVSGKSYQSSSDVELSALLGAFQWKGVTRSSGTVSGNVVRPSSYDFKFQSNSKSGSIGMGFDAAGVTKLAVNPDQETPADTVPLEPQHVKSVLDPLSAILAVTRTAGAEPCGRKVAVFDGKQRFDINLVPRGREAIEGAPAGSEGIVCRIKYVPVAGYRKTPETKAMAQNANIEVAFRPVGGPAMMMPYRVTLQTMAGPVALEAKNIQVNGPRHVPVALAE